MPQLDDNDDNCSTMLLYVAVAECGGITDHKVFKNPVTGFVGKVPPMAVLNVWYDTLVGTWSRHGFGNEFSINKFTQGGVTPTMFKERCPKPWIKDRKVIVIDDD